MIEHTSKVTVRYAETDQMMFAHHSNYIVWFEYARIELMRAAGINYCDMEKNGTLLPVLEVKASFKRPARFDDELKIKAKLPALPRSKLKFEYQVFNNQDELLCQGYSLHAFMNSRNRAVKPPAVFIETLKRYIQNA